MDKGHSFFDQMNQENLTLNGNVYVYEISNEKTNSRGTTKFAFPEELTVYMLYWIKALDKLKIKQNFWINQLGNSMTENQMNQIIKNNGYIRLKIIDMEDKEFFLTCLSAFRFLPPTVGQYFLDNLWLLFFFFFFFQYILAIFQDS